MMTMTCCTFHRHPRPERETFVRWLAGLDVDPNDVVAVTLLDEGGAVRLTRQPREVVDGELVPVVLVDTAAPQPPPWFDVTPDADPTTGCWSS